MLRLNAQIRPWFCLRSRSSTDQQCLGGSIPTGGLDKSKKQDLIIKHCFENFIHDKAKPIEK